MEPASFSDPHGPSYPRRTQTPRDPWVEMERLLEFQNSMWVYQQRNNRLLAMTITIAALALACGVSALWVCFMVMP